MSSFEQLFPIKGHSQYDIDVRAFRREGYIVALKWIMDNRPDIEEIEQEIADVEKEAK